MEVGNAPLRPRLTCGFRRAPGRAVRCTASVHAVRRYTRWQRRLRRPAPRARGTRCATSSRRWRCAWSGRSGSSRPPAAREIRGCSHPRRKNGYRCCRSPAWPSAPSGSCAPWASRRRRVPPGARTRRCWKRGSGPSWSTAIRSPTCCGYRKATAPSAAPWPRPSATCHRDSSGNCATGCSWPTATGCPPAPSPTATTSPRWTRRGSGWRRPGPSARRGPPEAGPPGQ